MSFLCIKRPPQPERCGGRVRIGGVKGKPPSGYPQAVHGLPQGLENLTVLDLTRVLAGRFCTMMLGDMGANVIKIEVPGGGDDTRAYPPFREQNRNGERKSLYFANINRNKKGIMLNLKAPQGKELFKELVKKADIVIYYAYGLKKYGNVPLVEPLEYRDDQRISPNVPFWAMCAVLTTENIRLLPTQARNAFIWRLATAGAGGCGCQRTGTHGGEAGSVCGAGLRGFDENNFYACKAYCDLLQ